MKLSELIAKVGDDNIQLQNLAHSSPCMNATGQGEAKVSFFTSLPNATSAILQRGVTCLILWMPTPLVESAGKEGA